jgi:hypothetical protein
MLLVKVPVVPDSVVCNPVAKGAVEVPQQTPLAVMTPPPSDVMLPPETALVWVIDEAVVVVRVASSTGFEPNETSLP